MLKDKNTYVKKDDMKAHKGNIKMSLVRNKSIILTVTIILSIFLRYTNELMSFI